ncbi:MAG TPA: nucleotidyl transferase AbiEii/AbiGii toxin family protein [Bacteriovoracaceae bacterium]|nr:nucleotidyl transferase AbiEii/AbiGii toxin family protein [Bacteriovoracaceae bacterium]
MHPAIEAMIKRYNCQSSADYKNALKEIMQEISLLGLSRQNFFQTASFYGGTALRIAHQLGRFSEDLDFTLNKADSTFNLNAYLKGIEDEFKAYNLKLSTEKKVKANDTGVDSAFLKANTLEHLLTIEGLKNTKNVTNKNDLIKIKLEVDINPPEPQGVTEVLYLLEPIPFSYRVQTLPSLFGGKLHALICREYKGGRVKGRDFYDFIWYISKKVKPDLHSLKGKLCESSIWKNEDKFSMEDLKELLSTKFEATNWEQAKQDVKPFIKDGRELELWSTPFFLTLLKNL